VRRVAVLASLCLLAAGCSGDKHGALAVSTSSVEPKGCRQLENAIKPIGPNIASKIAIVRPLRGAKRQAAIARLTGQMDEARSRLQATETPTGNATLKLDKLQLLSGMQIVKTELGTSQLLTNLRGTRQVDQAIADIRTHCFTD
jgi:hypothetical protein